MDMSWGRRQHHLQAPIPRRTSRVFRHEAPYRNSLTILLFVIGTGSACTGCGRIGFDELDYELSDTGDDSSSFPDDTNPAATNPAANEDVFDSNPMTTEGDDTSEDTDSDAFDTLPTDTTGMLDSGDSDTLADTTTDSATATSSGTARIPNSKALAFDGEDSYLNFGDVTIPWGTISFWIKTTATHGYIFSRESSNGASSGDGTIALDEGRLTCRMVDSDIHEITSRDAIDDNEWHHVALVFQPGMMLYIDGSAQPNSDDTLSTGFEAENAMLVVGRIDKNDDAYLLGLIDEFSTHDRHLLESEIQEIYNNQRPANLLAIPTAGALTHWWRMGDGDTPPRIADKSGKVTGIMMNMGDEDIVSDTP